MTHRTRILAALACMALGCAPAEIGDAPRDNSLLGDDLLDDSPRDAGGANSDAAQPDDAAPTPPDDDDASPPDDASSPPDAASPPPDAASPPPDAAAPPPDTGPDDPCAGTVCPMFASCRPDTGACACDPGFELRGDACVAPDPGDPAARAEADVCQRYQDSQRAITPNNWTPGATACDPGVYPQAAIDAGVERINLYRWLAGLSPLDDRPELNQASQACAVVQRGNGGLTHYPDENTPCYTPEGAAAAGHSNIAGGYATSSHAVDGFMEDIYSAELGHRRWILYPPFGWTGFGHVEGYYCQWVDFGRAAPNPLRPDFVAWPNPGFTPLDLVPPTWSFASSTLGLSAQTTVTLLRDGEELTLESYLPQPNYGDPAIAFRVPNPRAGVEHQLRLDNVRVGGQLTSLTYTVTPTACR